MDYEKMLEEVRDNHSAHWGGTYEEMKASDTRLANLAEEYPALYREALDAYNEMLRNM
jgi:sigma54-dependent transcription regulator